MALGSSFWAWARFFFLALKLVEKIFGNGTDDTTIPEADETSKQKEGV